jgi:hypothetical protein
MAFKIKEELEEVPIIVFGGGANLDGFSSEDYIFFQGSNPFGNHDSSFHAQPITDYVAQVDISNKKDEIQKDINLLILALGLTYTLDNDNYIPFTFPHQDLQNIKSTSSNTNRYYYYDLQDAVYK